MDNIVQLYGFSISILSDRDPRFVSNFRKSFQKAMETKVTLNTTYHLQIGGQTERMIQTLLDILRACALDFSGNWSENLSLIEFLTITAVIETLEWLRINPCMGGTLITYVLR